MEGVPLRGERNQEFFNILRRDCDGTAKVLNVFHFGGDNTRRHLEEKSTL